MGAVMKFIFLKKFFLYRKAVIFATLYEKQTVF